MRAEDTNQEVVELKISDADFFGGEEEAFFDTGRGGGEGSFRGVH